MEIIPTAIDLCAGNNHVRITATVGGVSRSEVFNREDFNFEPGELREAILYRLRSAVKEANATTLQQIRNALLNITFEV